MKLYDIVTIGDCFEDIFIFPEEGKIIDDRVFLAGKGLCFGYGDKVPIENIIYQVGGCAANTAVNFSKLNLSVGIISAVGKDSQGEKTIHYLENFGVDTKMVKQKKESNSNISVILSFKGDRTIFTYHGVNELSDYVPTKSLNTKWIYLGPLAEKSEIVENRVIEIIAKKGSGLIWNPGSRQISRPVKDLIPLLKLCNILFVNREEAYQLSDMSKKSTIEDVMKYVHSLGTKIIIVTNGAKGAKGYDGQRFYNIASSGDKRVEATGAGDAFASTFAANIIKSSLDDKNQGFVLDRDLIEKSLKYGVIVSGSVVGSVGAQTGLLSFSEILEKDKKLVKIEASIYTK